MTTMGPTSDLRRKRRKFAPESAPAASAVGAATRPVPSAISAQERPLPLAAILARSALFCGLLSFSSFSFLPLRSSQDFAFSPAARGAFSSPAGDGLPPSAILPVMSVQEAAATRSGLRLPSSASWRLETDGKRDGEGVLASPASNLQGLSVASFVFSIFYDCCHSSDYSSRFSYNFYIRDSSIRAYVQNLFSVS